PYRTVGARAQWRPGPASDAPRAPATGALGVRERCGGPGGGPRAAISGSVDDLRDLPRPDAAGADVQPPGGAVDEGPHTLDVRVPPALGTPVRVADAHAPRRALAAHLADGCHDGSPRWSSSDRTGRLYWRRGAGDNSGERPAAAAPTAGRARRVTYHRPS